MVLCTVVVILGTTLLLVQATPILRSENQNQQMQDSLADLPAPEFSDWHNETRQRDKERRLKAIEMFILEALGRSNKPAVTGASSNDTNETGTRFPPSDEPANTTRFTHRANNTFPGQLDSFQASCDLPPKVDFEAWTQPDSFSIFFNLSALEDLNRLISSNQYQNYENSQQPVTNPLPPHRRGQRAPLNDPPVTSPLPTPTLPLLRRKVPPTPTNSINIVSAKFRLYKIGRGPNAEPARFELPKSSEFCNNTNDEIAAHAQQNQNRQGQGQLATTRAVISQNLAPSEEKIFVKVYWYTAPITKHHYKKKLLDSRSLLVKESGWIDFDIQKAARMWLESKINYGLSLEVVNEDNDLVDPSTYFSNVHCPLTNLTNQQPPSRAAPRTQSRRSRPTGTVTVPEPIRYPAPILELCTLTLPVTSANDASQRAVSYQLSFSPDSQRSSPKISDFDTENFESHEEQHFWQNEDSGRQAPAVRTQHKRRHHHGGSTLNVRSTHSRDLASSMQGDSPMITERPPPETTTTFHLDGDHPLKRIFATAKTYLSRDEMLNRRRKHRWSSALSASTGALTLQGNSGEDQPLRFQPIILEAENIVIENGRSSAETR